MTEANMTDHLQANIDGLIAENKRVNEDIKDIREELFHRTADLETAQAQLDAVRVHANSGTSLSWRMQRIKAALEKE